MLLSINRYFLCALVVLICKRTDPTITVCCTPVVCSILVVVAKYIQIQRPVFGGCTRGTTLHIGEERVTLRIWGWQALSVTADFSIITQSFFLTLTTYHTDKPPIVSKYTDEMYLVTFQPFYCLAREGYIKFCSSRVLHGACNKTARIQIVLQSCNM